MFEELIFKMLKFYCLYPERKRGTTESGDQIDLLAEFNGKQILVETSYTNAPVGSKEIGELNSKLDIRQPNLIGIWISMSDFSEEALKYGSKLLDKKIIILFNSIEISTILNGIEDFEKLISKKVFVQSRESVISDKLDNKTQIDNNLDYEDPHTIFLENKEIPWILTTTNWHSTVAFSPIFHFGSDSIYWMEVMLERCQPNDIIRILKIYNDVFGITNKAAFGISQRNFAWTGTGTQQFLKEIQNVKNRYNALNNSDIHHSETAIFIDEIPGWDGGLFLLSMQPSIEGNIIDYATLSFMLEEMPFTRNRYEKFFEVANLDPECIKTIDTKVTRQVDISEIRNKPLRKLGNLRFNRDIDGEKWIDGIICENPFYGKPVKILEDEDSDRCRSMVSERHILSYLDKIIVFLSGYHGIDDTPEYYLREMRVTTLPASGFPAVCVNAIAYW